jgi:Coenzyme PQQ synthesis protein D (PqqD)
MSVTSGRGKSKVVARRRKSTASAAVRAKPAMMPSGRVIKAPGVLLQDLDGEAVLLNLGNEQYYGLDAISFRMYKLLVSSISIQAAYERLLQEYDVAPDQLRKDLQAFLEHLRENGLVRRVDDGPRSA